MSMATRVEVEKSLTSHKTEEMLPCVVAVLKTYGEAYVADILKTRGIEGVAVFSEGIALAMLHLVDLAERMEWNLASKGHTNQDLREHLLSFFDEA